VILVTLFLGGTDLSESIFSNANLSGADFVDATDFNIDIFTCKLEHAKFDRFEAIRLLNFLDIELID
jgi:uncharacterized protein YjbI with pentapeptide repeats